MDFITMIFQQYMKIQSSKNFKATTNLSDALSFSDFIFIVVDTPNGGGRKFYDHSKLSQVLVNINDQNVKNKKQQFSEWDSL